MDPKLYDRLNAVPPLNAANRQHTACKICGARAAFFDLVDFNKCCSQRNVYEFGRAGIPVIYFRCPTCGFLFTRFFDGWKPADFARFVYNDDYIQVDGEYAGVRPEREADAMASRLAGHASLRILDYGSGSGLFASHLRHRGFEHVTSYDPFSDPQRPTGPFDLITCFEVLEHTTAPQETLADIAGLLDPSGCVIFSTGIQPPNINELRCSWWYVAPRNGHASVYTLHALAAAGEPLGLTLHAGPSATAFAGAAPSDRTRSLLHAVGPSQAFFNLAAPGRQDAIPPEQAECWHGVEGLGQSPFRWTRNATIAWRLHPGKLPPGCITITVPVTNEVHGGFIDGCKLVVGKRSIALRHDGHSLVARFIQTKAEDALIKLVTPPVQRPSDLRAVPDDRLLGIAIPTAAS